MTHTADSAWIMSVHQSKDESAALSTEVHGPNSRLKAILRYLELRLANIFEDAVGDSQLQIKSPLIIYSLPI